MAKAQTKQTEAPKPLKLSDDRIVMVDPDKCEFGLNTNLVRKFNPVTDDYNRLMKSIQQEGQPYGKVGRILEPVSGTKHPVKEGWWIIERGNQRTKIAKQLNIRANDESARMLVPLIPVVGPTDIGSVIMRQAAENVRTDWTWVDKAYTAQNLANFFNGKDGKETWSNAQIGERLGMQPQHIGQYLICMEHLTRPELEQCAAGEIPLKQAIKLAKTKDKAIRAKALAEVQRVKDEAKKKAEEAANKATSQKAKRKAEADGVREGKKKAAEVIDKVTKDAPKIEQKFDPTKKDGKKKDKPETKTEPASNATSEQKQESKTDPKTAKKIGTQGSGNFKVTMQEISDYCVAEYSAGARGELCRQVGDAMIRMFSTGNLEVFTDELISIEEVIRKS